MTWLLRTLAGAAGPWILGAVALAFVSLAGSCGVQTVRLSIAKAEASAAVAKQDMAELQARQCAANRLAVEQGLALCNAGVAALGGRCATEAAGADAAGRAALERPRTPPKGYSAAELTAWFERAYSGAGR